MKSERQPMRSVWHSLLWKEWHEHKWKLAALMMVSFIVVATHYSNSYNAQTMGVAVFGLLVPYCVLAGTFLGMSTAGRESGRKTLTFLQSLPVPMWRPGIAKLSMAILTAVLPVIALGAFCMWWISGEGMADMFSFEGQVWRATDWVAITTIVSVLGVTSLLLWMAAAGANQSDEIRAGAVGFLVISFVWLVIAYIVYQGEKRHLQTVHEVAEVLIAAAPGGVGSTTIMWRIQSGNYLLLLATGLIGHGCVLAWYLRRFGRVVSRPSRTDGNVSSIVTNKNQQLGPPMRSQFTATAWKQIRETGPLSLMAVGGVLVLATAFYLINDRQMGARGFGEVLAGLTLTVGFLVTLVTGIGVFFEDLKPGVDDFWRSRPMNFSLWFGVKFVVGVLTLVVAFGTLFLFAYWLTDASLFVRESQPLVVVGTFVGIFLLIYTLAMATYCLLRQPIYAAVLTFGLLFGGIFVVSWLDQYHRLLRGTEMHWSIVLALMLFIQVYATAWAWQAVRSDWGWKG
ncbi:MAG: hypothetical protein GXP26_06655 [Planctomycetes bacterium]|nr:hypothetical protein [Planctomycetota bacterium]